MLPCLLTFVYLLWSLWICKQTAIEWPSHFIGLVFLKLFYSSVDFRYCLGNSCQDLGEGGTIIISCYPRFRSCLASYSEQTCEALSSQTPQTPIFFESFVFRPLALVSFVWERPTPSPPFQDNTFILFPIFYIPQYRERLVTWDIFFYKLHNTDHTCLSLHLTKKIVLF